MHTLLGQDQIQPSKPVSPVYKLFLSSSNQRGRGESPVPGSKVKTVQLTTAGRPVTLPFVQGYNTMCMFRARVYHRVHTSRKGI